MFQMKVKKIRTHCFDGPQGVQQFQHLLEALRYGCPPHGGIALGLDRLVAMVCKVPTLREVIAFPKTQSGSELMSGAPSEMTPEELKVNLCVHSSLLIKRNLDLPTPQKPYKRFKKEEKISKIKKVNRNAHSYEFLGTLTSRF
jgi:hypothetical protein